MLGLERSPWAEPANAMDALWLPSTHTMGVFQKADEPGIAAFIPIWNLLVLLKIVGRPWWWLILYIIPIVGLIVGIVVFYDLAKSFGHGVGFTIGLVLLSWIFLLILWLGSSRYLGPRGEPTGALA